MFEIVLGVLLVTISAEFKKITKKLEKEYLFEDRKYYYPISFVLNLVGFTLIFSGYGFFIAIMVLFIMFTYDKYISKIIDNKKDRLDI